jgi:IrrE N-terminal-like domain
MKRTTNPYLDKIASMVEERDTTRAVEVFVRSRRNSSDSLESLAHKLGVDEITEEKLPFEGGIFRENGRVVVKLNCDSSIVRKKFTLAHEIGHLFLETIPGPRSKKGSDVALERICDSIAAELLMPAEEAVPFIRGLGSPCPQKLRLIASKFGVSHQVAAIRVRDDFKLWKCCIGLWEWQTTVQTMWFVGERRWGVPEPDSYSLQLAIDSTEPVRTTELWTRGGFTEQVWLNLLNTGSNRGSGANRVLGLVAFVQ